MMALICIAAFFIVACPAGFKPDGWESPTNSANQRTGNKNWRKMLADPVFYVMILMITCGAFSGLMVISQASPVAQRMIGMSVTSATAAVSVLAMFNTTGRILAGYMSDKIGSINTILIVFVLSVMGLGVLYFSGQGDELMFYAGVSIVGFCFSSIMGIYPGFTAAKFGAKNNSVNYGIMFIGFAVAGYFGPTIMSNIYASSGNYQKTFVIAALLSVTGIGSTFIYQIMTHIKN